MGGKLVGLTWLVELEVIGADVEDATAGEGEAVVLVSEAVSDEDVGSGADDMMPVPTPDQAVQLNCVGSEL
jgi:hypothetical protein